MSTSCRCWMPTVKKTKTKQNSYDRNKKKTHEPNRRRNENKICFPKFSVSNFSLLLGYFFFFVSISTNWGYNLKCIVVVQSPLMIRIKVSLNGVNLHAKRDREREIATKKKKKLKECFTSEMTTKNIYLISILWWQKPKMKIKSSLSIFLSVICFLSHLFFFFFFFFFVICAPVYVSLWNRFSACGNKRRVLMSFAHACTMYSVCITKSFIKKPNMISFASPQ